LRGFEFAWGRKHDFKDAERLVRRLMPDELILSFVPKGEQRIWRSLTRMKVQLTRDRVRLQNQMECLLEEMRIKLIDREDHSDPPGKLVAISL
jgi:transposase